LRELAKTSGLSAPAHLRFLWCYDEPEILRCSNRQFGPIGADAGHLSTVNLARQLYCVATKIGPGAAISPNMPKPISWNIQRTGHAALTRDKYPISAARRHHPRRHGICLRKASEHRAKRQSIAQSVRASRKASEHRAKRQSIVLPLTQISVPLVHSAWHCSISLSCARRLPSGRSPSGMMRPA